MVLISMSKQFNKTNRLFVAHLQILGNTILIIFMQIFIMYQNVSFYEWIILLMSKEKPKKYNAKGKTEKLKAKE
jgi:hypothetical protein